MAGDHNSIVALLPRCPTFDVMGWHDRGYSDQPGDGQDLQGSPGDEHDEKSPGFWVSVPV